MLECGSRSMAGRAPKVDDDEAAKWTKGIVLSARVQQVMTGVPMFSRMRDFGYTP